MIVTRSTDLSFMSLPGRRSADPLTGHPTEGVSSRIVWLDTATGRNPHRHPLSPEITYVVEGTGTAWQNGETHRVGPGDLVFIPTGVSHATLPDRGSRLLLVCFFPHPDLPTNTEEIPEITL